MVEMGSVCWLAMSIYILPHSFMLLHYDVHYLCLHKHPQDPPTCIHTNKEHHQRHTDAYGDTHTCSYVPALCACVSLHAWHYACVCAYSMCIVDVSHARVTLLAHNTMEGKAAINQSINQSATGHYLLCRRLSPYNALYTETINQAI